MNESNSGNYSIWTNQNSYWNDVTPFILILGILSRNIHLTVFLNRLNFNVDKNLNFNGIFDIQTIFDIGDFSIVRFLRIYFRITVLVWNHRIGGRP
jgi:hypothetical protein